MRLIANIKFEKGDTEFDNIAKIRLKETIITLLNQTVKLTQIYVNTRLSLDITTDCNIQETDIVKINTVGENYFEELYFTNEEVDPDTMVFIFTTNVLYPENTVEKMLKKWLENDTDERMMIGSSGLKFGRFPFYKSIVYNNPKLNKKFYNFDFNKSEPVDVLFFSPGVLTLKSWLPKGSVNQDIPVEIFVANYFQKKLVFKLPPVENERVISKKELWSLYKKKFYTIDNTVQTKYIYTFSYPLVLAFSVFIFLTILFIILFYCCKN